MIINNRYEEPYNKFPNDGPIPLLSKPIVISKLSKKFWLYSQYLRNENILQDQEPLEGEEEKPAEPETKAPVKCPHCGAVTTPDANGCCEYCGLPVEPQA